MTQNIRVVVTGANPQTFSVQANIDGTGSATVALPITGGNIGTDTVQAFFDLLGLSSNQAQVTWQPTNGLISVSPVQVYWQNGYGQSVIPSGLGASGFQQIQQSNSLIINAHPTSVLPGFTNGSGDTQNPLQLELITYNGTFSSGSNIAQDTGGAQYVSMVGSFVVAAAGSISFTGISNQGFVLGCPGASFLSGSAAFNGVTNTPIQNYPAIAGRNGSWPGGNYATDTFVLNFPTPGIYPFEVLYASGSFSERTFSLSANNSVICPANMQTVPAPPQAGTGNLILTPTSAGLTVLGTTENLSLRISGLTISTVPYIPVLEGQSGEVYVSNQSGQTIYNFPALPGGGNVDYTAAVGNLLSLSGDNAAWQGLVSIATDGNNFKLVFNGGAANPNIAQTQLTVSVEDLAWFNTASKTFDSFALSGSGGGSQATVQVNWLVAPSIGSIGGTQLNGDGGTYQIAVNLAKPLPPVQTNIQANFTATGGMVIDETLLNVNSNGFVTGWTLTVTTPVVGSQTQVTLNLNATGALTYLSGGSFVTNTVTYINGAVGQITLL